MATLPASFTTPKITLPFTWDWIRFFDIILATAALIALAPLLVLTAIVIRMSSPGPAIFIHKRIGRDGKTFGCWKFRTMACDADMRLARLLAADPVARAEWNNTQKLRNDPRITAVGHFLRRSSIDELPQLYNVLTGTMSWVGPRPIVPSEIGRYGHHFPKYCAVRPGITGLWQVSGRSNTSYRRRVAMDVMYVRKRNVALYGVIMARTVPAVLLQRGSC
ncbi:MAG: sugar transferase [Sphingomonadales bacterium]|nr:sugar transferase [Sphingomonadales bacterium]MDE2170444.1 sugar transferase [Sphingomonadales bacterium]